MSTFSRSCLLRNQCVLKPRKTSILFGPINSLSPRSFNTTSLLRAARKARVPAKTNVTTQPKIATIQAIPPLSANAIYAGYAQSLAEKAHPTLLYEAASQTLYIVFCYSGAIFCFAYAAYATYAHFILPLPGIAPWVPYAFLGVSVFMAGIGTWLLLGPTRLVRTITAIPKTSKAAMGAASGASGAGAEAGKPELQVEILLRKMLPLPFFPARRLYVKPEDIVFPTSLCPPPPRTFTTAELRQTRIEEELRRKREIEHDRSHVMTIPLRHMSRALWIMFKTIGRTWTRDGFMSMRIRGQKYKLDVSGGWALEGGRALDRIAKIKP